ncbi:MAG TPA: hypothetical protein VM307_04145 [Egibacteraceae bacterium]|nr:hypothetical protein [Egibacteraceae bacterium]
MTDLLPARTDTPLSVRAVDKVAGLLEGDGSTRRRFLYRLAVIGSALAIDPFKFILRPTPAYASVCGSGNTCGAGWSVFCCTINNGANTCPKGSFVAGWWKVDASAFCLGSARYYIDCNRRPGSSCRCRCNTTGCDRRRVCCNVFRYGQCNTQIKGVTEVVCRLVTCTPPWQWSKACGRTVRVSESTRSHTSRCLPGQNPSHIEIKYQDMGLVGSVLGKPTTRERDGARGGRKRFYERGMILWHRDTGAREVRGAFANRYRKLKAEAGELGYPRTDRRAVGDGKGFFVRFERGTIYRAAGTGTRAVIKRADRRYRHLGGPRGALGYPTTSTRSAGGNGRVTSFQRGDIYMSPRTAPREVTDAILTAYRALGGPAGSKIGFPTHVAQLFDGGGRMQRFERGVIAGPNARRVHRVRNAIADRWRQEGANTSPWGYPIGHTEDVPGAPGWESPFQRAVVFWSKATGPRWLRGRVLRRYRNEGGPAGWLGFPVTDLQTSDAGVHSVTFQGGTIAYDPATNQETVVPH